MRSASLLVVYLILVLNFSISESYSHYALFLLLLLAYFVRALMGGRILPARFQTVDYIPVLFLLVWGYGFVLGLLRGNPCIGVVRNFAGMAIYGMYYILLSANVSRYQLFKTVYRAALLNVAISLAGAYWNLGGLSFAEYLVTKGPRLYYSGGLFTLFFLISVLLLTVLMRRGIRSAHFDQFRVVLPSSFFVRAALFLTATLCVLLAFSKGFMLSYIFVALAMPALLYSKTSHTPMLDLRRWLFVFLAIGLGVGLLRSSYGVLVTQMFAHAEVSNSVRYEQTRYLLDDLTVWGKGLGAGLSSGYARDALGYGFEVSYVNIVHKFGVFAGILILAYAYTLWKTCRNIFKHVDLVYSVGALGAMAFLFPAIGNPTLMSTISCLLHCVALYLLRRELQNVRAERSPAVVVARAA